MDKIKQAQDAKKAADQAKAGGSFMFGDQEIGPPLSPHIILTIIVNFFIAPVGHYLSRPNDFKSNSFLLVAGVFLAAIIIKFIPGLESIMSFVLYPLYFMVFCWNCFVAVLAERKRPEKQAAKDSGVVDLER